MAIIGNPIVSTDFPVDYFSGNGSTTAFTLSIAPASVNAVDVEVSGVSQSPQTYTISGTTLTFSAAPPSGSSNIVIKHRGVAGTPNVPALLSVAPAQINSSYALWNLSGADVNYTTGNVGIGTSSPTTQKLHISGLSVSGPTNNPAGIRITDTLTNEDIQLVNRSGNMLYNVATGNNYSWQINSTEVVTIDLSGNVGINTTSQGAKLELKASGASGTQLQLTQYNSTDGWKINADDNGGPLRFIRQGASLNGEAMRIDNAGNVFVGGTTQNTATSPVYASNTVKAWVNFNGSTPAITSSFNVSSVTRSATGQFLITMTNALVDKNYVVCASCINGTTPGVNGGAYVGGTDVAGSGPNTQTTTQFYIGCFYNGTNFWNPPVTNVVVFR